MVMNFLAILLLILQLSSAQRCIFPGRYRDYTDATGRLYYVCNEFGGTPIYFRCPKNNVFNTLTQLCETINNAATKCSWIQEILGKSPDPDGNGTTYIDCTNPSSGPKIVECISSLFSPILLCCFNTTTETCYN